jgi:integrase
LNEIAPRWLDLRRKKTDAGRIEESTHAQDECHWRLHIQPVLGKLRLDELTLQRLVDFVLTTSKKLDHSQTVRNVHSTLKTLLDAVEVIDSGYLKWLPRNPARHPEVLNCLPDRGRKSGRTVITVEKEAVEALLRSPCVPVERKVRYVVALASGIRDGELAGLTWSMLVTGRHGIAHLLVEQSLKRKKQKGLVLGRTKTRNGERDVPLHPFAQEVLAWWHDEGWGRWTGRKPDASDFIFPGPFGRRCRPRSAELLRRDLVLAGQSHQVPASGEMYEIQFHSIRATFCTWLADAGVPMEDRASLMGQGGGSVNAEHYTAEDLRRLMRGVSSLGIDVTVGQIAEYEEPTPEMLRAAREGSGAVRGKELARRRRFEARGRPRPRFQSCAGSCAESGVRTRPADGRERSGRKDAG